MAVVNSSMPVAWTSDKKDVRVRFLLWISYEGCADKWTVGPHLIRYQSRSSYGKSSTGTEGREFKARSVDNIPSVVDTLGLGKLSTLSSDVAQKGFMNIS